MHHLRSKTWCEIYYISRLLYLRTVSWCVIIYYVWAFKAIRRCTDLHINDPNVTRMALRPHTTEMSGQITVSLASAQTSARSKPYTTIGAISWTKRFEKCNKDRKPPGTDLSLWLSPVFWRIEKIYHNCSFSSRHMTARMQQVVENGPDASY
jgi:hypothetical protein